MFFSQVLSIPRHKKIAIDVIGIIIYVRVTYVNKIAKIN